MARVAVQDDVMFPMLTPRETFWFSAQLKLPLTERNKKAKVDALIEEVTSHPGSDACSLL
jgi:ABC-type multidrug transport system ATPase subunit